MSNLRAYCYSKLANIYFTAQLHERIKGFNIYTFSLHPGSIGTELFHPVLPIFGRSIITKVIESVVKNTYYGCQTTMACMLDDDILKYSGDYFNNCQRTELFSNAKDDEVAEMVWNESVKLVQPWLD